MRGKMPGTRRRKRSAPHPKGSIPSAITAAPQSISPVKPGLAPGLGYTVALVGRPNVGKSSLFNAMVREEISITDSLAGTTRDRVLHPVEANGRAYDLLDTGGIGIVDKQDLSVLVETQISAALAEAHIFLFVVDAKDGLTSADLAIGERIRKTGRPVIVLANKSESQLAGMTVGEFERLGFSKVIPVSALHRQGLGDVDDALFELLPEQAPLPRDWETLPKIAVIGRRNVGKSSFVNALCREERSIVSDVAGTTRDAVDLELVKDGQRFLMIDTAGLRRMKAPEGPVEFFSQVRTERAIRRADVTILMIDAEEGFSTTDLKTADRILELFKPCVIAVNKWDKVKDREIVTEDYADYIAKRAARLRNSPVCFTSAKNSRRCWQTVDVALDLYRLSQTEISTPKLNKVIEETEREHEPPARKNKKPRLLYGVQVARNPITFVVYSRNSKLIDEKYRRYLTMRMAEKLGLTEVPLRIFLREADRKGRAP